MPLYIALAVLPQVQERVIQEQNPLKWKDISFHKQFHRAALVENYGPLNKLGVFL